MPRYRLTQEIYMPCRSASRARPLVACRSALPLSTEGTKEPKGRKKGNITQHRGEPLCIRLKIKKAPVGG